VSAIDDRIDELYALPLAEFTAARNALAKTLKGDDAAAVKRLEKPSVVAWSVNQLYWRDRRTFDRLMNSGKALRNAQIAALKGRAADLRDASSEHRAALAAALAAATRIAGESGARPSPEPLSRMLEALSLAPELPASPGRFTDVIQPAGFEALAGITPVVRPHVVSKGNPVAAPAKHTRGGHKASTPAADAAEERRRAEEDAARRKAADAAAHQAQRALDAARATEARAQALVDTVRRQLERAESDLERARTVVKSAQQEVDRTEAAVKALDTGKSRHRR
jgi:hypothetical protein